MQIQGPEPTIDRKDNKPPGREQITPGRERKKKQ